MECMYFDPKHEHVARAGCFGTQLVDDGIWVPFALESDPSTTVRVALEGEPLATSVSIKRGQTTEAEAMKGVFAQNREVDRGTLADGWWILTHEERNNQFKATVQRTLAGQDLVCEIYDYGNEAHVRRGMTTCLMLEPVE
jgi:hypothetical protein